MGSEDSAEEEPLLESSHPGKQTWSFLRLPALFEEATSLAAYRASSTGRDGRAMFLQLPREGRAKLFAAHNLSRIEEDLKKLGKCSQCMLLQEHCICERLSAIRTGLLPKNGSPASPVHFIVWMHPKERKRASNTGKLVQHILPDNCEVLTHDVPAHESRIEELTAHGRRAFVLFPSEGALPASEALLCKVEDQGHALSTDPPIAILIDGTWRQAKQMHKRFEALPHIALSPTGLSEFHWRRQSQEGRISTVEAAALLLEELACNTSSSSEVAMGGALRQALSELMMALERQCHYDTLPHGKPLPEALSRKKAAEGSGRLRKRPPGQRAIRVEET